MAPSPLAITNISILVVPNIPTTRMLILLILIILPATPFPLSPSIPHRSYSRTPFPLSQHSTPLLFPHAIPLSPSIPHHSYSRTPDTAHSPVTDPVEASAHPMLDGDSLPVRYGVHGQREGIVLYQHLEELLRGVFAIGAFEKME